MTLYITNKTNARLLFLVCIVFIQSCQTTKNSGVSKTLKFNFEKGRIYDYNTITTSEQEVDGQESEIKMTANYSLNVSEDIDSVKTVVVTYKNFSTKIKAGEVEVDADSEKSVDDIELTPSGIMSKMFSAIKGEQFQIKVNNEGKVLGVIGMQELSEKILNSMNLDKAIRVRIQQAFDKQFSVKSIKEQFEKIFYIFPNKSVTVGEKWDKSISQESAGNVAYVSHYEVAFIEGDMVTLSVNSKIETGSDKIDIKGTIDGTMVIDSRNGLVVSSTQNQNLKGEVNKTAFAFKGKTKVLGTVK